MQMLICTHHHRIHFGTRQQRLVIRGNEIGVALVADNLAALGQFFRNADPADSGVTRSQFAANETNTARANDGQANFLWVFFQLKSYAQ